MAEKQRILIVDDDANIAELISLYLMKECYETMIVGDGEEALKRFPDFKPNLVLLDLMLPGMDCLLYTSERSPRRIPFWHSVLKTGKWCRSRSTDPRQFHFR